MDTTGPFEGVIAPVVTPFLDDGAPDADRFVEHAKWLLEDGCNALAPFGTTSEANSIGLDDRMALLEELVDAGIDASLLMPGTGTCSVADTVMLTQHAIDLGCSGVLMLPPFYYKNPSDEGVFRFFSDVIEEAADDELAVYLYNIPQMSGVAFSVDLVKRLRAEFPEVVVGLKDSSGDWENMKSYMDEVPDFDVFPGSELYLLDGLKNGGVGVISACANINARGMRRVFDAFEAGDDRAAAEQERVTAVRKALQAYPMIPALKSLIAHYRDDPIWAITRPPFVPMPVEDAERAAAELAQKHDFVLQFDLQV